MRRILRSVWRRNRFALMPLPIRPWCAISPGSWDPRPTSRERTETRMASVASTYARAFADVVFSAHLDAARAVGGLRSIAALFTESVELRRVWENPAVPADQ